MFASGERVHSNQLQPLDTIHSVWLTLRCLDCRCSLLTVPPTQSATKILVLDPGTAYMLMAVGFFPRIPLSDPLITGRNECMEGVCKTSMQDGV